jgi:hypothetical protein
MTDADTRARVMYAQGYLNALEDARDCLLRVMPGKLGDAATPDNVLAYFDALKAMRRQAEVVLENVRSGETPQ